MSCCGDESIQVSRMATELKSGYLLRYKRRIFGKDWREEFVVLYSDSTLVWYKEKGRSDPEGGLIIKDAPELMAYGLYTSRIPNRPDLPNGYQISQLMAFGTRGKETVHWFLCPNVEEVMDWMTAFSNTLPPPPQPPSAQAPTNMNPVPQTAPPPTVQNGYVSPNPANFVNPGGGGPPPPYHLPGMPLQPAYAGAYSHPGAQVPPSNNTTIITQDPRRNGFHTGDFAMGFLMGGAITGWGSGWGWGGGLHHGGWGGGGGYHITDIHNHIDINNTTTSVMNNDTDLINTVDSGCIQDDMIDTGGFEAADFDVCADFGGF